MSSSQIKSIKVAYFYIFVMIFILSGCSTGSVSTNETQKSEATQPVTIECRSAYASDLLSINDGMYDKKISGSSGFFADLPPEELAKVISIFPSYENPRIVAAFITGSSPQNPVGLWAIQQVTDSGSLRITALDANARRFSMFGSGSSEGSPAAQLRDQLLRSSYKTNIRECIKREKSS